MPRSRRDDDDDDDDDYRPRRKTRRDRDDDDEDEDDEDDTPRRKRSRSIADDDDEEDEDDRPRKRKALKKGRKKAGGGSGPLLLILGLAGGLFLLAGGGVAVWLLFFNDTPEKAFEDFKDAVLKRDYGRMYDRMDKDGQQEMEKQAEFMVKFDRSMSAAHSGKKGRELVVAVHKDMENKAGGLGAAFDDKMREEIKNAKVEKVEVNGDTATLTVKGSNGRTDTGKMVKQDGRWRIKKK